MCYRFLWTNNIGNRDRNGSQRFKTRLSRGDTEQSTPDGAYWPLNKSKEPGQCPVIFCLDI